MGQEFLGWALSVPLISGAILAAAPLLAPSVRWSRRLRNDLEVWRALPDGREKDAFGMEVKRLARRLNAYRTRVPTFEKVIPWLGLVVLVIASIMAIVWGFRVDGVYDAYTIVFGNLLGLGFSVLALSGRSPRTLSLPEHYTPWQIPLVRSALTERDNTYAEKGTRGVWTVRRRETVVGVAVRAGSRLVRPRWDAFSAPVNGYRWYVGQYPGWMEAVFALSEFDARQPGTAARVASIQVDDRT